MAARVKICGVTTAAAIGAAVANGASHLGFNFFPPSPRNLDFDQAAALAATVPDHVARVGVFVDPDEELLTSAIAAARLTAIQLHGTESPAEAAAHRRHHGLELWKVIPVRTRADLELGRAFKDIADRLLYDARTPKGSALPGGMGLRFDWKLLDGFDHPLPWALSGGLDAENVAEAIGITGARLVDASSGLESAPGIKDVDKIAAFMQAVARS
jgi:phosphoribosylanthranilate isomerase